MSERGYTKACIKKKIIKFYMDITDKYTHHTTRDQDIAKDLGMIDIILED